jgi:hypothetical protein
MTNSDNTAMLASAPSRATQIAVLDILDVGVWARMAIYLNR